MTAFGNRLEHRLLAERLGARVVGLGIALAPMRRHMGQAGTDRTGGFGDGARAELVDRGEFLAAALVQDADQVDDMIRALDGAVDRPAHAQIGLHRLDLADIAERLQMAGKIGTAAGDANPVAALGERPHHMAPDKA